MNSNSPRIRCPACHNDTLTLNKGRLLCTWIECKDPTLISRICEPRPTNKPETEWTPQEWAVLLNQAYSIAAFNCPVVHGQLLPNPQTIAAFLPIIRRIMCSAYAKGYRAGTASQTGPKHG